MTADRINHLTTSSWSLFCDFITLGRNEQFGYLGVIAFIATFVATAGCSLLVGLGIALAVILVEESD